jgi:hypothetical protein
MASALVDRPGHHCQIVNIRGSSYRMGQHLELQRLLAPSETAPKPQLTTLERSEGWALLW